jgi:hypothetical protein
MPDAFLSRDDVRRLTGRARYSAQVRALQQMKIPHRINAAGEPIVLWQDVLGERHPAVTARVKWQQRFAWKF